MEIKQGTDEWLKSRLGKVTASRVIDVMAKTKTGYSATRKNYLTQLVVERLTNTPAESFNNSAMQWGTDTEPLAREAYEAFNLCEVKEVALINHPTIVDFGASPDGLVGEDGLIEIKCPNTATHIEYLTTKKIPKKYLLQMQTQMMCIGREWCDFVSFDPRLPEKLQMLILRVEYDKDLAKEIESEVIIFLKEVENTLDILVNYENNA